MSKFLNSLLVDFVRLILHNIPCLDYSKPGKNCLTNVGLLALHFWVYLKGMITYLMIYW